MLTMPMQLCYKQAAIGGRQQINAQQHARQLRTTTHYISVRSAFPKTTKQCLVLRSSPDPPIVHNKLLPEHQKHFLLHSDIQKYSSKCQSWH